MNSSGIKRGLAATAIAALAVTGVPAIASAAPLPVQETAASSAVGVNLRSVETNGTVSVATDGTNNTISLVATGGTSVEYVTFQRDGVNIPGATVSRSANGDFQFEWTPPVGVSTASISAVRTDAAGAVPVAPAPVNTVASTDTATGVTISGTAPTVEIAPKNSLGYFAQPTGGDYTGANSGNNVAGISGTTSQSGGVLAVDGDSLGVTAGPSPINLGAIPGTQNSQAFNGTVSVTGAAIAGDNDQILPVLETTSNTRDAQGFNVYAQTISGINVSAAPLLPDSSSTTITVTVTDQNGQPVAGARVERDNTSGGQVDTNNDGTGDAVGGFTNGLGQVQFLGAAAGTQSYYVETTATDGFNTGVDFRGSVSTASSRPDSIAFTSADGDAFDLDEYDNPAGTGNADLRVQVKDAAGNALEGQRFFYRWTFTPFVTNPAGPSVPPVAGEETVDGESTQTTVELSGTTNAQGFLELALPAVTDFPAAVQGQVETITTTGGTFTLNGYVNRDGSNPGQDPVDLALTASSVKAGESAVSFDGPAITDRQLGTTQTATGTVALRDGTALVGRTVQVTYNPSGNSAVSTTQPTGTTRLSATSATAVTQADGKFSVAVTDPSTPTTPEYGDLRAQGTALVGTAPNTRGGIGTDAATNAIGNGTDGTPNTADDVFTAPSDLRIRFSADAAPRNINLTGNYGGAGDPYLEVSSFAGPAGPGRPAAFQVNLVNSAGQPLAGQQVTLTTDAGFFTPNVGAPGNNTPEGLTAETAPAEGGTAGVYRDLGDTITVTTDQNGRAIATLAIGRDAGFDDDTRVTANVSATAGTATNSAPIQVVFDSSNALNPGEVSVDFSAQQGSGVNLPEARAMGVPTIANPNRTVVNVDVVATDQFGNRTDDAVVLSDNSALAGFVGEAPNGTVTVNGQLTSGGPSAQAFSNGNTNQVVTATWTTPSRSFTDSNAATPGFQAAYNTVTNNTETDSTEAIDWYVVDFAQSTFTLTSDPEGNVPVGTAVTETIKVVDQRGNPVQGLAVEFIRQGPADQDGDPNQVRTTNANGEAFYSFTGTRAGVARISAVVTDGTQNQTVVDTVEFGSVQPVRPNVRFQVFNLKRNGFDKVKVIAPEVPAGTRVNLFKLNAQGEARRVKSKETNAQGKVVWIRADLNGPKRSRYYAVVTPTDTTTRVQTDTKGAR